MTRLAPIVAVATLTLASAAGIGRAGGAQEPDAPRPPAGSLKEATADAETATSRVPGARKATRVLADYVVEPPDLLIVEVLEALEGQPISGERLVRPDGRISLGFYGEVYVAGLTIMEVKEKVVNHLRKYLSDELLGLVAIDPETGGKVAVAHRDSSRVFVDVTNFNSKNVYALGTFNTASRLPFTGSDTLLDVVLYAGGLADDADAQHVMLVRENPRPGEAKTEIVDVEAIIRGADDAKNFQLWPGDRLIAKRRADAPASPKPAAPPEPAPADLQARLDRLEARLDLLLKRLGE